MVLIIHTQKRVQIFTCRLKRFLWWSICEQCFWNMLEILKNVPQQLCTYQHADVSETCIFNFVSRSKLWSHNNTFTGIIVKAASKLQYITRFLVICLNRTVYSQRNHPAFWDCFYEQYKESLGWIRLLISKWVSSNPNSDVYEKPMWEIRKIKYCSKQIKC